MYDFEIANYLYKMAKIQSAFLDSPYRAKAYYSAAIAIDSYTCYIEYMYKEERLQEIPYVGAKIKKSIEEIIETGHWNELEQYEIKYQIKDYTLLLSHGLSDTIIKKLINILTENKLSLDNGASIEQIAKYFTKKEYAKLIEFTNDLQEKRGKYLFAHALCLAEEMQAVLNKMANIVCTRLSGELEEYNEKVHQIDIEFVYTGSWKYLISKIKKDFRVKNVKAKNNCEIHGETKYGIPFVLHRVANIETKTISYTDLNLKGDLHTHTIWTDGIHSLNDMLYAAKKEGYEYLAITDHTKNMSIAHGLSENQALAQIQEIRKMNETSEIKLLAGIEVDILPDGSLDYSDEVLSQFDFVIAAIHSQLKQSAEVLFERLEKALSNPYVNILAHPTGRLLGRPGVMFCEREECALSIKRIVELCKKYNVVMESNCFPERFDLNSKNINIAVSEGVRISFGTDAHSIAHLSNLQYAFYLTRNMDIGKEMILNTYSYENLIEFFKMQRVDAKKLNNNLEYNITPKNFSYYFGNNERILTGDQSVVGIDLTGSSEKESGVAYLSGNKAICRRLKTDEEILSFVKVLQPDIVSIDSPLAYPKGRCCSDKNCKCADLGIMRQSEKLLRHFGIMVYPCLIDSMVNLTTRGMYLAAYLRNEGFVVIESYPGVAQDILQIPRKGKTEEQFSHLKQGLRSFGITGDICDNFNISHDEVDAITSALVGYFYLNNQYVGLGNPEEDYLIVPRIQEELLENPLIIGLCGETAAGKTTLAEYLRFKYGLGYCRYSDIISEKYRVTDKASLQEIGEKIANNPETQRDLTRTMLQKMEPNKSYVIDGLRHYEDYEELKKAFGKKFIFIGIECSYANRYKRYKKLKNEEINSEEFKKINNHNAERDIPVLMFCCDYRIDNNKGFKDLRLQMDNIIQTWS